MSSNASRGSSFVTRGRGAPPTISASNRQCFVAHLSCIYTYSTPVEWDSGKPWHGNTYSIVVCHLSAQGIQRFRILLDDTVHDLSPRCSQQLPRLQGESGGGRETKGAHGVWKWRKTIRNLRGIGWFAHKPAIKFGGTQMYSTLFSDKPTWQIGTPLVHPLQFMSYVAASFLQHVRWIWACTMWAAVAGRCYRGRRHGLPEDGAAGQVTWIAIRSWPLMGAQS